MILREHSLTLSDWETLPRADRRFLRAGAAEYAERRNNEAENAG